MGHARLTNQSGFTLVEFAVAVLILLIGMLGLLQGVNVALNNSQKNQLRNEATLVADQWLAKELAKGFQNVSTTASLGVTSRPILNGFVNYSVTRSGRTFQNSKEVRFQVSWKYRGATYTLNSGGLITNNPVIQQ